MAIPGLRPTFEVRAKVRIGEKKKSARGVEYPSSVDYFLCDDSAFQLTIGHEPKELRIFLPHQLAADNFSTGLEWWQGKLLACYSKGEMQDGVPVALRRASMEQKGQTVNLLAGTRLLSEEVVGQDRRKIECPVRECPILKRGDCKPMGRLLFWIDGIDRQAGVYQLDTKSWNSIENLEATLSLYPDLRGVPFKLRVEFTQRGRDRFPELYLEPLLSMPVIPADGEKTVDINNEIDAELADALVQLDRVLIENSGRRIEEVEVLVRPKLAAVLDLTNPGWRQDEVVINWVKDQGPIVASEALLRRHLG